MNECLTTPQLKNKSAIGCQTFGKLHLENPNGAFLYGTGKPVIVHVLKEMVITVHCFVIKLLLVVL